MVNIRIYFGICLVLASFFESSFAEERSDPNEDAEIINQDGNLGKDENEEYYRRGGGYYGGRQHGYAGEQVIPPGVVRTKVTVQKRILRPVLKRKHHVYDDGLGLGGFEGSYVAVSGRPGQRTIHKVNGRGGSVAVEPGFIGRGPGVFLDEPGFVNTGLPKCSYLDTDFFGDDVGDGRGLSSGSPYACKQRCIDDERCQFWTFRQGWARDCYLKRGDGRNDVLPDNVTPRGGFVSGTIRSDCVCLRDNTGSSGEICPVRRSGGRGFPWRGLNTGFRLDYDYDDIDDGLNDDREIATRRRVDIDGDGDLETVLDDDGDDNATTRRRGGSRRRNRTRSRTRSRNRSTRRRGRDGEDVEEVVDDEQNQ